MVSESPLRVSVVFSPAPRVVHEVAVVLMPPCTLLDALKASGLLLQFPDIDNLLTVVGVWNRKVSLDHHLRDQDRIEIYRPLRVDPKVARRERFVRQGSRGAGLFVKKRPGAKAGY